MYTKRYSNSIKKSNRSRSPGTKRSALVRDFDASTNKVMEVQTNRLSSNRHCGLNENLLMEITAENEDLKAQIRSIKNQYELGVMDQKKIVRELRSKLRMQNISDFEKINGNNLT